MKKTLALILALLMCFVMTACGGSDEDEHYEVQDIEIGSAFGDFTSVDLNGNEVTQDVFGEKDVTIVNVWGTYCLPCIMEMPLLVDLSGRLPDNAQVIGIVVDAAEGDEETIDDAKLIMGESIDAFTNILVSDSVKEAISSVEAVPTTFIVDREGKIVCTPIVGADVEAYEEAVNEYLKTLDQ